MRVPTSATARGQSSAHRALSSYGLETVVTSGKIEDAHYETSTEKYPIFYVLHGATDGDNSWSTVGRAGVILDNLIAEKKAKPMMMVMPHGHTAPFTFGGKSDLKMEEFVTDFQEDIKPFVERRYRVYTERAHRAIAGLSMDGAHTLDIATRTWRITPISRCSAPACSASPRRVQAYPAVRRGRRET